MISRRTIFGTVAILIILAAALLYVLYAPHNASQDSATDLQVSRTITLDDLSLHIAIADTETLRERGLGGLSGLSDDEGMLFVFPEDGIYSFWMKDMRFAIDIIWLDADGRVTSIEKSVSPETYPKTFTPSSPSRYVLELRAGLCDQHDIRIGSKANLK